MGEPFQKPGSSYTIIIKAEKPVLGYAVTPSQADHIRGNRMTPQHVSCSDKIPWGLIEPGMVMERVPDETKTFMVDHEAFFASVIDVRGMQSVGEYRSSEPFP